MRTLMRVLAIPWLLATLAYPAGAQVAAEPGEVNSIRAIISRVLDRLCRDEDAPISERIRGSVPFTCEVTSQRGGLQFMLWYAEWSGHVLLRAHQANSLCRSTETTVIMLQSASGRILSARCEQNGVRRNQYAPALWKESLAEEWRATLHNILSTIEQETRRPPRPSVSGAAEKLK